VPQCLRAPSAHRLRDCPSLPGLIAAAQRAAGCCCKGCRAVGIPQAVDTTDDFLVDLNAPRCTKALCVDETIAISAFGNAAYTMCLTLDALLSIQLSVTEAEPSYRGTLLFASARFAARHLREGHSTPLTSSAHDD